MTEYSEHHIDYRELRHITVTCQTCKAEISFDIRNQRQRDKIKAFEHESAMRFDCPFCGETLHIWARVAIQSLWQFLDRMDGASKDTGIRLWFRIPQSSSTSQT